MDVIPMSMRAANLPREVRHDALSGALRDLTRWTLRATSGVETPESIASRALETLATLCDAQRGAIVLMPNSPDAAAGGVAPLLSSQRQRVLAVRGMAEEEARLLCARDPSSLAGEEP